MRAAALPPYAAIKALQWQVRAGMVDKNRGRELLIKILLATAATISASAAIAQNDMAPMIGRSDAAPARVTRALGFTALGTYGNQGKQRLMDVRVDADSDGDGAKDQGVLRVTCSGGDILNGHFLVGQSTSALKPKLKVLRAQPSAALAAGKTFKGSWDLADVSRASLTSAPVPLTVSAANPDICAGLN